MNVNRREIARYLGYKKAKVDETVSNQIELAIQQLEEVIQPKFTYEIFDVSIENESIEIGSMNCQSKNLATNLRGCKKAAFFAATLGLEVDNLIKRTTYTDIAQAAIMQACAAAMIEQFCDECQEKIALKLSEENLYLRPRFSAGYGDFSIDNQKHFIQMLNTQKKIGLFVTDSFMLVPTKSVTAVIGITSEKISCHKSGCETCEKLNCEFRRGE